MKVQDYRFRIPRGNGAKIRKKSYHESPVAEYLIEQPTSEVKMYEIRKPQPIDSWEFPDWYYYRS